MGHSQLTIVIDIYAQPGESRQLIVAEALRTYAKDLEVDTTKPGFEMPSGGNPIGKEGVLTGKGYNLHYILNKSAADRTIRFQDPESMRNANE